MATRRRPPLNVAKIPTLLAMGLIAGLLLGGNSHGQDSQQLKVRGVTYSVVDGELRQLRSGGTSHLPVPTAMPEGTGRVHGISSGPAGTVYVAAERGLFTTCPEVEHLDLMDLQDGAPTPPFLGVEHVRGYRLYVVTATELACFDTRQFFARRVTSEGVGPGPFLGLAKTANGALEIKGPDQVRIYQPDRDAPPRLQLQVVDGQPFRLQHRFEVEHGTPVVVGWSANAGANVRYRLSQHHIWRPLDHGSLPALEPGNHTVLFAAFDQDLQRSEPVPLQLRVRYPPQFDKRFLVPTAALGSLAILLLLLARARRGGAQPGAYRRAAISAVLIVVLSLQLLVALFPHGRSWPFVGFSMYTEVYQSGGHTFHTRAFAVRKDGSQAEIGSFSAGFSLFEWKRALVPLVFGPDQGRQQFLTRLQRSNPDQGFVGFVIRTDKRCLTSGGPVSVAPLVMRVHPEHLFDDDR